MCEQVPEAHTGMCQPREAGKPEQSTKGGDFPNSCSRHPRLPGSCWSSGVSCKNIVAFAGRGRRIEPFSPQNRDSSSCPPGESALTPTGESSSPPPALVLCQSMSLSHPPRRSGLSLTRWIQSHGKAASSFFSFLCRHCLQTTLNFFPGLGIRHIKGRR